MEGLRRENLGEQNFDSQEKKNPTEELVREYIFPEKRKDKISLSTVALEEGRSAAFSIGGRMVKNESALCNIKKEFEKVLLEQNQEDAFRCLKGKKAEYCNSFIEAFEETKKQFPRSKRKIKPTVLDIGWDSDKKTISSSEKAEKSFEEMGKGMIREITVIRVLNAILDSNFKPKFKARIANSELDIKNKIDVIAYSAEDIEASKTIIAVQIKGNQGDKNTNTIEEVFSNNANHKKEEFYNGCEDFEKKLKIKESEAKVLKIWVNVPDDDIIMEGAGYKDELKKDIETELLLILNKY